MTKEEFLELDFKDILTNDRYPKLLLLERKTPAVGVRRR